MMSENLKRIIAAAVLAALGAGVGVMQYHGLPAVRWACVAIAVWMFVELGINLVRGAQSREKEIKSFVSRAALFLIPYSLFLIIAAYFVGGRVWTILMLLATIIATDTGAWAFGKLIGGDKMWPHLSAGKTWAGQIAGIVCGAIVCVIVASLMSGKFIPGIVMTGIAIALLSQYGDLTASWIKRKLGIKDFGNIIPGHGGIIDRFDGWIYVLPIIWMIM
jgi:CDP-diglyceride synthetase